MPQIFNSLINATEEDDRAALIESMRQAFPAGAEATLAKAPEDRRRYLEFFDHLLRPDRLRNIREMAEAYRRGRQGLLNPRGGGRQFPRQPDAGKSGNRRRRRELDGDPEEPRAPEPAPDGNNETRAGDRAPGDPHFDWDKRLQEITRRGDPGRRPKTRSADMDRRTAFRRDALDLVAQAASHERRQELWALLNTRYFTAEERAHIEGKLRQIDGARIDDPEAAAQFRAGVASGLDGLKKPIDGRTCEALDDPRPVVADNKRERKRDGKGRKLPPPPDKPIDFFPDTDEGRALRVEYEAWMRAEGQALPDKVNGDKLFRPPREQSFLWRTMKEENKDGYARFPELPRFRFKYDFGGAQRHRAQIEVHSSNGKHLGTIHPITEQWIGGPEKDKNLKQSK